MPWRPEDRQQDYGPEYRRKRLACLRAARWRCQIRLPGCQGSASQADHIDGVANDPHHDRLRATCVSCHNKVTAEQGKGARAATPPPDPAPRPATAW